MHTANNGRFVSKDSVRNIIDGHMRRREGAIRHGKIGQAPQQRAETMRYRLAKPGYRKEMDKAARHQAAADPSDPFAYARAMTRMRNGIHNPDHYKSLRRVPSPLERLGDRPVGTSMKGNDNDD